MAMLSSIGRAAVQRLASGTVATSSRRLAASALNSPFAKQRLGFVRPARLLATAAKTAKTAKTQKSPAAKPTKKRTTAASSSKAKKPVKKKLVAKKKPAKPKKLKRTRKVLTPEQTSALQIRELKKLALFDEPKRLPVTTWQLYVTQQTQGTSSLPAELSAKMTGFASAYKSLSSSELSRLKETAEQNKLDNAAAYKAWIESHSVSQIVDANNARNLLARKYNYPKRAKPNLKDERQPKRATTSYLFFTRARWASGDYANMSLPEASRAMAREWKALSDHEKEPFENLGKAEGERYEKDVASILNRTLHKSPSP